MTVRQQLAGLNVVSFVGVFVVVGDQLRSFNLLGPYTERIDL